ncbi:MAG TPA: hypothetical protein VGQ12_14105 [Candidatus Angelobacter sp.]|nr:hypothetical protein [Candidatus Angelobacter sp.]
MSLKKWERDVLNRQRNIVFSDTNLNEGRFYRNIASGKAVFSLGQKVSLLIVAFYFLAIFSAGLAGAVGGLVSEDKTQSPAKDVWICAYLLAWLLFWIFLALEGLFPAEPQRRVRKDYRPKRV